MKEDNTIEYLILAGGIGLFLYPIFIQIKIDAINFYDSIINFTKTNVFYLTILGLILIVLGICIYFAIKRLTKINKEDKEREKDIEELREKIKKCLNEDILDYGLEEVLKFIQNLEELKAEAETYRLNHLIETIEDKLSKAKEEYGRAKERRRVELLEEREQKAKKNIKELEQKQYEQEMSQKEDDRIIASRLKTYENPVFRIKDLRIFERKSLLRQGYKQVNEYDLVERKIITVLVNPPLNHSPTHTFLVWSAKKLLEKIKGVSSIIDHDTKYADVTFRFKNEYYALEIETGSLLFHKKRLIEKVEFLDSKFNGKWFFIVSNKTLVSKYRKFGPATQRSEVEKKLLKMLEKH